MSQRRFAVIAVLRWLFLPVACFAAWWVAFLIAILISAVAHTVWIHDDKLSLHPVVDALVCFGAALAAIFVILAAYFVAPSARNWVVWVAFALGALIAVWFAIETAAWPAFAAALVAGCLTAIWLT
jgi:hypothetical protein